MNAVLFDRASKDYAQDLRGRCRLRAVDEVSFQVERGEIFGLVGPNRAGKTTLVKLLLSLCRASRGRLERLGRPVADRRTLARVGYVHENQAFPRYLSAPAFLEYCGALSLLDEARVKARAPALLELVGLGDRAREPIARFSKGMIQRLGIAQALINDPELLVFDEPSEGLDLDGRKLIRALLAEQRRRGAAVLYVSHLLPEVEQLCDRVGVMAAGRLVFVGPISELTRDPGTGGRRPLESALPDLYAARASAALPAEVAR